MTLKRHFEVTKTIQAVYEFQILDSFILLYFILATTAIIML